MQFNGNEFSLHFVNIETRRDMLDVKNAKRVNVESLEGSSLCPSLSWSFRLKFMLMQELLGEYVQCMTLI